MIPPYQKIFTRLTRLLLPPLIKTNGYYGACGVIKETKCKTTELFLFLH